MAFLDNVLLGFSSSPFLVGFSERGGLMRIESPSDGHVDREKSLSNH